MRKRVTYQLARGDAALVDRFSKFTKTKWTVHTHVRVRRPYGLVMHQYSSRGAAAGHSGTTLHSPHWRPHTPSPPWDLCPVSCECVLQVYCTPLFRLRLRLTAQHIVLLRY